MLAAVKAKDNAGVKALAARDDPDPWLVADELIGRAEPAAAVAFAKCALRKDTEALPAYIAAHRVRSADEQKDHEVLAAATTSFQASDVQRALELVEAAPRAGSTVLTVQLGNLRSLSLRLLSRRPEAQEALFAATDEAGRLGWLAFAAKALEMSAGFDEMRQEFASSGAIWERLLPVQERRGDPRGQARALGFLVTVRLRAGRVEEGVELGTRAAELARRVGDRAGLAGILGVLGMGLMIRGDLAGARAAMLEAIPLERERGNPIGAALNINGLAELLLHTGEFQEALRLSREAYEQFVALGNVSGRLSAKATIAQALLELGDLARGLTAAEELLDEARSGGRTDGEVTALGLLARVQADSGDSQGAIETWRRAEALSSTMEQPLQVLAARVSIASLLASSDDLAGARKEAEAILAQCQESHVDDGVAASLGTLGTIAAAEGDFVAAVHFQKRALEVARRIQGSHRAAIALVNLSSAQLRAGDLAGARSAAESAINEAEKMGARDIAIVALANLAQARLNGGDAKGSLRDARRAVSESASVSAGLGSGLGTGFRESRAGIYETGTLAARDLKDRPSVLYFLESSRASALVEALGGQQALMTAVVPPELLEREAIARAQEAFTAGEARASAAGDDLQRIRAAKRAYQQARKDLVAVEDRIQREALSSARLAGRVEPTLPAVQKALLHDECLVLYCVMEKDGFALVVTANVARMVDLGPSERIRAACRDLLPDASPYVDGDKVKALAALVVTPLALEATVRRVLVSPEDELSCVPFALLVTDRDVVHVPSGTVYGFLRDGKSVLGEGVLALGDPDYQTQANDNALQVYVKKSRNGAGMRLPRLEATEAEAKAVGDVVLLQEAATEEGLTAALGKRPRWRSIHLACHGVLDTERPALSSLAVTASERGDGFLTAVDVVRMKAPADLVVLSACETAKGKIVKGEGIVGLTRAFMFAGAPRVICSLWKVDDEATRALMTKFYELWNPKDGKPGLPTAEALRKAQEFVKSQEKWKHPYYWAAWVLWGLPD